MKLHNLFENIKLRNAMNTKQLLMLVGSQDGMYPELYIITDVPQISHEKYLQLQRVSFGSKYPTDVDIMPLHLTHGDTSEWGHATSLDDWYTELKRDVIIKELKWKQFVVKLQREYPPGMYSDDDFSE